MHIDFNLQDTLAEGSDISHGELENNNTHGELKQNVTANNTVNNGCTLTKECHGNKVFSKIILVKVYPENNPSLVTETYAKVDSASNRSFMTAPLFKKLNVKGKQSFYNMKTLAGHSKVWGKLASNMIIESHDSKTAVKLPQLLECKTLPCTREEIPDPSTFECQPHLAELMGTMPTIQPNLEIGLLLGLDTPEAHKNIKTIYGPHPKSPWFEQSVLGCSVSGNMSVDSNGHIRNNKRLKFNSRKFKKAFSHKKSISKVNESSIKSKEGISEEIPTCNDMNLTVDKNMKGPLIETKCEPSHKKCFYEKFKNATFMMFMVFSFILALSLLVPVTNFSSIEPVFSGSDFLCGQFHDNNSQKKANASIDFDKQFNLMLRYIDKFKLIFIITFLLNLLFKINIFDLFNKYIDKLKLASIITPLFILNLTLSSFVIWIYLTKVLHM